MNIHMKRKTTKNFNTFENRMLMLNGMPAVRVKTELLESEQEHKWTPEAYLPDKVKVTVMMMTCQM